MPSRNALTWFEIPVDDFARARGFYESVLAITMEVVDMGAAKMGMFPYDQSGGVGGAIVEAEDFLPARDGTRIYLDGGDDLTAALMRVDSAGGKVRKDKTLIAEGMGYYATFLDSEGNRVGLYSTK